MSWKKGVHPLIFFFFYPGDGVAPPPPCAWKKRRVGRKRISTREKQKSPALTCFVKDTAGGFLAMCEAGTHHTHTKSIPEEEGAGEGRQHHVSTERERCGRKKTHTHQFPRVKVSEKRRGRWERGRGETQSGVDLSVAGAEESVLLTQSYAPHWC